MLLLIFGEGLGVAEEDVHYGLGDIIFAHIRMKSAQDPTKPRGARIALGNPIAEPRGDHLMLLGDGNLIKTLSQKSIASFWGMTENQQCLAQQILSHLLFNSLSKGHYHPPNTPSSINRKMQQVNHKQ